MKERRINRSEFIGQYGAFIIVAVLLVIGGFVSDKFFSAMNIMNILESVLYDAPIVKSPPHSAEAPPALLIPPVTPQSPVEKEQISNDASEAINILEWVVIAVIVIFIGFLIVGAFFSSM
jgi:hypothetical protein